MLKERQRQRHEARAKSLHRDGFGVPRGTCDALREVRHRCLGSIGWPGAQVPSTARRRLTNRRKGGILCLEINHQQVYARYECWPPNGQHQCKDIGVRYALVSFCFTW